MLRPKEVVCRWVDAFNAHDAEAAANLYHDNAVNHQVANEPVEGKEAIREMFAAEFAAADMTAIVENIFEDGRLCCFKNESLSQYPLWNSIFPLTTWKNPQPCNPSGSFHSKIAHLPIE